MAIPRQIKLEEPNEAVAQTPAAACSIDIQPLTSADANEALGFLATNTVDNIFMIGLIRDNGVESSFNRGTFYAARSEDGRLEGVALIGHATLIETRTEEALAAFARLAKKSAQAHVIVGQQEKIESFWNYYGPGGQLPRQICRELLLEQRAPILALEPVEELRRATLEDLPQIAPVNAAMAEEESGVNPLHADAVGFRTRLQRRIEQGRIWVWTKDGQLIFKVDVMAEAPGVSYLEGVYIHPRERGRGYGARCLSQLGRRFLARERRVCLLVNERNKEAQVFFFKAGYKLRGCYDTIFLQAAKSSE
jgi:predicted GNAT family acetyltransferase